MCDFRSAEPGCVTLDGADDIIMVVMSASEWFMSSGRTIYRVNPSLQLHHRVVRSDSYTGVPAL